MFCLHGLLMRVQLDRQIFNSALHISDFDLQSNLYCTCSSNLSFNINTDIENLLLKERWRYLRIFSARAILKNNCRSFSSLLVQYGGQSRRLARWLTKEFWPKKKARRTRCAEKLGQWAHGNFLVLEFHELSSDSDFAAHLLLQEYRTSQDCILNCKTCQYFPSTCSICATIMDQYTLLFKIRSIVI